MLQIFSTNQHVPMSNQSIVWFWNSYQEQSWVLKTSLNIILHLKLVLSSYIVLRSFFSLLQEVCLVNCYTQRKLILSKPVIKFQSPPWWIYDMLADTSTPLLEDAYNLSGNWVQNKHTSSCFQSKWKDFSACFLIHSWPICHRIQHKKCFIWIHFTKSLSFLA